MRLRCLAESLLVDVDAVEGARVQTHVDIQTRASTQDGSCPASCAGGGRMRSCELGFALNSDVPQWPDVGCSIGYER
jgi:hypothetical protein